MKENHKKPAVSTVPRILRSYFSGKMTHKDMEREVSKLNQKEGRVHYSLSRRH